jgi:spore maturation protein CgeB
VLASGGFVVSDKVLGMNDLLDNSVPTYETREELEKTIDHFIRNDAGRERLAERGGKIALQYTYAACCGEIIRHIKTISGTLFL